MQWVKDKKASLPLTCGMSSLPLKDRDKRKEISSVCIVFCQLHFSDPKGNNINDCCLLSNYYVAITI